MTAQAPTTPTTAGLTTASAATNAVSVQVVAAVISSAIVPTTTVQASAAALLGLTTLRLPLSVILRTTSIATTGGGGAGAKSGHSVASTHWPKPQLTQRPYGATLWQTSCAAWGTPWMWATSHFGCGIHRPAQSMNVPSGIKKSHAPSSVGTKPNDWVCCQDSQSSCVRSTSVTHASSSVASQSSVTGVVCTHEPAAPRPVQEGTPGGTSVQRPASRSIVHSVGVVTTLVPSPSVVVNVTTLSTASTVAMVYVPGTPMSHPPVPDLSAITTRSPGEYTPLTATSAEVNVPAAPGAAGSVVCTPTASDGATAVMASVAAHASMMPLPGPAAVYAHAPAALHATPVPSSAAFAHTSASVGSQLSRTCAVYAHFPACVHVVADPSSRLTATSSQAS